MTKRRSHSLGCIRGSTIRLLLKASLAIAVLIISIAAAPAVKADPITVSSGGFSLFNLGNDCTGVPGLDALDGAPNSTTHNINAHGSFVALLNHLTFTTGFTGANSGGNHPFTFSQPLTINRQTQFLTMIAIID